jgi:hypothetical protein
MGNGTRPLMEGIRVVRIFRYKNRLANVAFFPFMGADGMCSADRKQLLCPVVLWGLSKDYAQR